jgi:uncharacterized lipoprotein YajG
MTLERIRPTRYAMPAPYSKDRQMPFRTPILILASCAVLAGCNVNDQGHFTTTGPDKAAPTDATAQTNPAKIQLLTGTPERAYTQLGPIKVTVNKLTAFHPNPSVETVEEAMRKKAAALGADAIIQVDISDIHIAALSWGARTGKGIAVKY